MSDEHEPIARTADDLPDPTIALPYSADRRHLKLRRNSRVFSGLTILALVFVGWRSIPVGYRAARAFSWKQKTMHFDPPAGTVVYDRSSGAPGAAIEPEFLNVDGAEVGSMRLMPSQQGPEAKPPIVVTRKIPECYVRLLQTEQMWLRDDTGAVVFCHERVSPAGHSRLVAVSFSASVNLYSSLLISDMDVVAYQFGWRGVGRVTNTFNRQWGFSGPSLPPPHRIFAGRPDPADPSHFTIEYEWPDRSRGIVDGWLRDTDQVDLAIRPGPGDLKSARLSRDKNTKIWEGY